LAELKLFDKLFGAATIATLDELKAKSKKMLKRIRNSSRSKLLGDVTEFN
jgi:hypothetical protein